MRINVPLLKLGVHLMAKDNAKRVKKMSFPDSPLCHYDVNYAGDKDFQHCFDLLIAPKEKRNDRLFIDIHGGGYLYGIRKNNYSFGSFFYDQGYDVALADYDLVKGDVTFKNQIEDVAQMISYLLLHLKDYGIENDEVVVAGDSAGGHLALLIGEAASNPDVAHKLNIDAVADAPIKAIITSCTVYDYPELVEKAGEMTTLKALARVIGPQFKDLEFLRRYSPRSYIDKLTIPLFYSSCRNDILLNQYKLLDADLKNSDLPHLGVYIDAEDKKIGHVHNVCYPDWPESLKVNNAMLSFMDEQLK